MTAPINSLTAPINSSTYSDQPGSESGRRDRPGSEPGLDACSLISFLPPGLGRLVPDLADSAGSEEIGARIVLGPLGPALNNS